MSTAGYPSGYKVANCKPSAMSTDDKLEISREGFLTGSILKEATTMTHIGGIGATLDRVEERN
eukprot:489669-Pelagomonas_calceolata.AAC.2